MNIDVALNRIAHQKVSFFFNSFFFKKKIVSDTKIGFPAAAGWLRVKKRMYKSFGGVVYLFKLTSLSCVQNAINLLPFLPVWLDDGFPLLSNSGRFTKDIVNAYLTRTSLGVQHKYQMFFIITKRFSLVQNGVQ
jgi:hypothetical protein